MTNPADPLGYVVIETTTRNDSYGPPVHATFTGALYPTADLAERERARAEGHNDLDADMFPDEKRTCMVGAVYAVDAAEAP